MGNARMDATATLLPNGKVLIAGGSPGAGGLAGPSVVASAELYDPATRTFTATGSLKTARTDASAALLADGRVLIVGGYGCRNVKTCTPDYTTNGGDSLTSAELYDPATGEFTTTGSMSVARCNAAATVLPDGGVLILSGGDSRLAEVYDPTTGRFTHDGSLLYDYGGSYDTTNAGCATARATLLPNGKVLVTGYVGDGSAAELFDPTSGKSTSIPLVLPLLPSGLTPNYHMVVTATSLKDGRVLVCIADSFGDYDTPPSSDADLLLVYDSVTNSFSQSGWIATSDGWFPIAATLLLDGRVLFAGGYFDRGGYDEATNSAGLYDPATGFQSIEALPRARVGQTTTLLPDGTVSIAGGTTDQGNAIFSVELFEPSPASPPPSQSPSPTLTPSPTLSGPPPSFVATGSMHDPRMAATATLLQDGKVLIAGGETDLLGDSILSSAELYDPTTGTFTVTGSMTAARANHTATLLSDGRVLIAGGEGCAKAKNCSGLKNSDLLASAELYDPATGTFTRTGSMSTAREFATATRLSDGRVLIAAGGINDTEPAGLYDPEAGRFTRTGTLHGHLGRLCDETATLLPDGSVLVIGRADSGPSAELYDPAKGKFTVLPFDLPSSPTSEESSLSQTAPLTATLLADGHVLLYVPAEEPDSSYLETYDPATGAFAPAGDVANPGLAGGPSATLLADGRVLFAGGPDTEGPSASAATVSDPLTGPHAVSGMQVGRTYHTATLLPDGTVLIVGGLPAGVFGIGVSPDLRYAYSSAELFKP
jgi:WD40 repeat protein